MVKIPFIEKKLTINFCYCCCQCPSDIFPFPIFFPFLSGFLVKGICPRLITHHSLQLEELVRGHEGLVTCWSWRKSGSSVSHPLGLRDHCGGGRQKGRKNQRKQWNAVLHAFPNKTATVLITSAVPACKSPQEAERKGWGHWTCTSYSSHFFQSFLWTWLSWLREVLVIGWRRLREEALSILQWGSHCLSWVSADLSVQTAASESPTLQSSP